MLVSEGLSGRTRRHMAATPAHPPCTHLTKHPCPPPLYSLEYGQMHHQFMPRTHNERQACWNMERSPPISCPHFRPAPPYPPPPPTRLAPTSLSSSHPSLLPYSIPPEHLLDTKQS